ncbi:hypothetical protein RR51_22065 [Pseudomonas sp. C5pp]|nr:hypothetical protein RR51_22065 [Pseudomonas sp. C5pp]
MVSILSDFMVANWRMRNHWKRGLGFNTMVRTSMGRVFIFHRLMMSLVHMRAVAVGMYLEFSY